MFLLSPVFLFVLAPNATSSEKNNRLSKNHRHSHANKRTFPGRFLHFFSFGLSLSFSSDIHIMLFGFKVKPQQPVQYGAFLKSSAFMIHASQLLLAAWIHLSSSSTRWNSCWGFPTWRDDSLIFAVTNLSVQCGHAVLSSSLRSMHLNMPNRRMTLIIHPVGAGYRPELLHLSLFNSIPYLKDMRNSVVPLFHSSLVVVSFVEVPLSWSLNFTSVQLFPVSLDKEGLASLAQALKKKC